MSRYRTETRRNRYQRTEEPQKNPAKLIFIFLIAAIIVIIKFFPFTIVFPSLKGVINENPDYIMMFTDIKNVVKSHIFLPETANFILPLTGEITSPFGERPDPVTGETSIHNGIDIDAPENSSVVSATDGEVTEVGEDTERGKYIIIKATKEINVLYQHLNDIYKVQGDIIKQNEEIAISGNTGKTTSPHLHFEIIKNGTPVNPMDYIK